jgi:hypothetical protein
MAEVVLFHHAQGLTPGVIAFADQLRTAGHTVHTPDLFEGRTFGSIEAGMAHVEKVGFGRSSSAVPGPSTGSRPGWCTPASHSGSSRPRCWRRRARGPAERCCVTRACRPRSSAPGRTGCRCRCTGWTPTRSSSAKATSTPPRALVAGADDGELFLYPGDQHYFADSSLPSYDAGATALLIQRTLDFLRAR